jgi:hypothetical protein
MNETTHGALSRRQLLEAAGTAAAAVAATSLAGSAEAAPPPQGQVPFKATLTGAPTSSLILPLSPPLGHFNVSTTGQADLLGPVTYVDHHVLHFGADGQTPLYDTDGVGVMTAANGDALFFTYIGLFLPAYIEEAFTIVGGKGAFLGATGSGTIRRSFDPATNKLTDVFEGTVSAPQK